MIIITEGIDCSGKSTLIEALAKEIGYEVQQGSSFSITANKTEEELFEAFMSFTKLDNIILDRYMYSNLVYAPLYNDYACLSDEHRKFIEREIKGDTLLVYLCADKSTIAQRFKTRGEEYVDESKITAILDGYDAQLGKTSLDFLIYDTSYLETNDIVKSIVGYLENKGGN